MEKNSDAAIKLQSIYIPTVESSTNTLLMQRDFSDYTVIYTFNQISGRGRLGRQWVNIPNKNLAFSIGLRSLKCQPIWITAALSVAATTALEKNGLAGTWIKWPNDIFVGQSKLAGVLTESTWENNKIDKCVAGIGINLNSSDEELRSTVTDKQATSFFAQTNKKINLEHFANCLQENIVDCLELLKNGGVSYMKQLWLSKAKLIGEKTELSEIYKSSSVISGVIENIDDDGFLYFNDGTKTFRVVTGDIKIIF